MALDPSRVRRVLTRTVGTCVRYRVTGLAAEAAFFAILSLPPLVFGLFGTVGYVLRSLDVQTVGEVRNEILELASRVLAPEGVEQIVEPTVEEVLRGGRADVVSIGFVLAMWSGSRALNVFIDTISIMYGLGGRRGIVRSRVLSFGLYALALLVGIVVMPLALAGPQFVTQLLPEGLDRVVDLYWPLLLGASVGVVALLYHVAVPAKRPWRRDLPGAALCLVVGVVGSLLLRWVLSNATGTTSVYGPLAAPIAMLAWLYLVSLAVLIGAALNAALESGAEPAATPRAPRGRAVHGSLSRPQPR